MNPIRKDRISLGMLKKICEANQDCMNCPLSGKVCCGPAVDHDTGLLTIQINLKQVNEEGVDI